MNQKIPAIRKEISREFDITYLFGEGIWSLRDCYVVWEFKKHIDSGALGKAYRYAVHLSREDRYTHYVILGDITTFYIIEGREGVIISVNKGFWVKPGSKSALVQVLNYHNENMHLLMALCSELEMTPIGFLGSGGFGRCFVVEDKRKLKFALKTILNVNDSVSALVHGEFHKLRELNENTHVINVVTKSLKQVSEQDGRIIGSGYLMEQVGEPLNPQKLCDGCLLGKLFDSLSHIHLAGYFHGDARIYNAVLVNNEIKWVDFVGGGKDETEDNMQKIVDMKTLIKSIFNDNDIINENLEILLNEYQQNLCETPPNATSTVESIVSSLRPKLTLTTSSDIRAAAT